ncbi:putative membrane protein putative permease [Methanonatronarchaeum thermophilum]|uniref:Putative membrane protein putative permease n=1 Tax=Methanonatronarchaeum thermophilum TaxID=1927129 RepID=A0A1Y3GDJ7_9EURY|nr:hypothetical protein [Methanonatronarchaeum thermophilum]OUJ18383.1 putative membrane protein putative permease [Methanonatronarchaeum thermophilum]
MDFFEVKHGLTIGELDVRRTVKTYWGMEEVATIAVYLIIVLAGAVAGGYAGYQAAGLLGGGELAGLPITSMLGGIIAVFWVFIVFIMVFRALGERGTPTVVDNLLHVTPLYGVCWGILFSEIVYILMWILIPAVGVGVGFALGGGGVVQVLLVPLVVVLFAISSIAVGYPLGIALRYVLTRFRFIVKYKVPLIIGVFFLYILLVVFGLLENIAVSMYEPVQSTPMAWYADLLLIGVEDVGTSVLNGFLVLLFSFLLLPLSVFATRFVGGKNWFSDPVLVDEKSGGEVVQDLNSYLEPGVLSGLLGGKVESLMANVVRQTVRKPIKSIYAALPILIVGPMFVEMPGYLPFLVLFVVVWAAGSLFSLNILGDQGSFLPTLLLTGVRGKELVWAHLLPTLFIGVPVGVVLVLLTGYWVGVELAELGLLLGSTILLMVLGSFMSVWLGTVFPRFDSIKITKSMSVVLPSKMAYIGFTFYLALCISASVFVYSDEAREIVSAFSGWVLPFGLELGTSLLLWGSILVLVLAVIIPIFGYRRAVVKIDKYTLE